MGHSDRLSVIRAAGPHLLLLIALIPVFACDQGGGSSNGFAGGPDASAGPVAVDDSYQVAPGDTSLLDVFANDSGFTNARITRAPSDGSAVLILDSSTTPPGGGVNFTAPATPGQYTFEYLIDTPDPNSTGFLEDTATVTVTVGDGGANIDDNCDTGDGSVPDSCQFDDVSLFSFISCSNNFGAGLVCDNPFAAVTHNRVPDANRDAIVELNLDGLNPGTRVFQFTLPTPDQSAQRFPSDAGGAVQITSNGGSVEIFQDGSGNGAGISSVSGDPRLQDNDTVSFAINGVTQDSLIIPGNGLEDDDDGNSQTLVRQADGLSSSIFLPDGFNVIRVLIYTHTNGETDGNGSGILEGFLIERVAGAGISVLGGTLFPLVPDPVLPELNNAGGPNPDVPIVITTVNRSDPVAGVYGGSGGGAGSGGGPVTFTAGPGLGVPSTVLTPPPAACPNRPVAVRCTAGNDEVLMATDSDGEVALFNAVDGQYVGDFLSSPNFVVGSGWLAQQAPDNCVVVSDDDNGLWLYDPDGQLIPTDGMGNASDPGSLKPLIENSDVGVRGFGFHSPDGGNTQHLYIALNDSIVRYDYAVTGNNVLSNRSVLITEAGAEFNDVSVIGNLIYASDQSPDSTGAGTPSDLVRIYDLAGASQGLLADDLATPYQISELLDGNIGLVSFGTDEVRIVDSAGNTQQTLLLDDGDADNSDNPRGVGPQRDGNFLVAGRSEVGVSTIDRRDNSLTLRDSGNTERYIGTACLNP